MDKKLRWGILATGRIAHLFAEGVKQSQCGALAAIGSRTEESARKFAQELEVPRFHGSYQALLEDPDVDIIYISTPHPLHAEWSIRAANARKHLLVEKPVGMNHAQAMQMIESAAANDVFFMEAFMYRCHPQTHRLVELIRERAIGDVRVIHATFSFHWPIPKDLTSRLLSHELGGGGILDVGCYCMSIARLIAGAAIGKPFAEPVEIKACGHIGADSRVDEWTIAALKFPGEIVAQLATGVQCRQESVVRIDGSEGNILLPNPYVPSKQGGTSKIIITRYDESHPREVLIESAEHLYAIEADTVARHLSARQAPEMSWDDTLGNMRALDAWRAQIGLVYDVETPQQYPRTQPASSNAASPAPVPMKFGRISGLDKPVSRLVLGCDNQSDFPHAAAMFDDFFARGGNAFDTAWIYHRGLQERLLGEWIRMRNVREQVVIIVKGAHTPYCVPATLSIQLFESLDRLGTDYADIYLLHRDNPQVPVGEFVDVLDEHARAGRIRSFGGSNWTIARMEAANDYAARHDRRAFSVLSNQFSLARLNEPPWEGCLSAGDAESRHWLARTQTPLLAWSSQAQGFFTADPAHSTAQHVRCWHSERNFRRRERVIQLAQQKGVLPTNIALAWVLSQPFPCFALIGPRQLGETRTTWTALQIELSPEELRWLDAES